MVMEKVSLYQQADFYGFQIIALDLTDILKWLRLQDTRELVLKLKEEIPSLIVI